MWQNYRSILIKTCLKPEPMPITYKILIPIPKRRDLQKMFSHKAHIECKVTPWFQLGSTFYTITSHKVAPTPSYVGPPKPVLQFYCHHSRHSKLRTPLFDDLIKLHTKMYRNVLSVLRCKSTPIWTLFTPQNVKKNLF